MVKGGIKIKPLKLLLITLLFIFILAPQTGQAAEEDFEILPIKDFCMNFNGYNYHFVQQIIRDNENIYVPTRKFLNVFGVKVEWDPEEENVSLFADYKEYVIDFDLEKQQIRLSSDTVYPIKMYNSRSYIPLSFVREILNFNFTWDEENKTLSVVKIPDTETIIKDLPEPPEYKVVETFTGIASWYGEEFNGRKTNSGEIFDENALTAAHRTLPFNTYVRVTFLETNKSTIVRINDRGPHVANRVLDLSKAAAEAIGLKSHGLGEVKVEVLAVK